MRRAAALLTLALLLVSLPATAQPPTYTEAFQVHAAVGNIPLTPATEPAGFWNVEQRFTIQFTNTTAQPIGFLLPVGSSLVNATCSCGVAATVDDRSVTFQLGTGTPSGTHALTVLSSQSVTRAFGFEVMRPLGPGDGVVVLYVPTAYDYEAPIEATASPGLSTDGSARIVEFRSATLPNPFWASLHIATVAGGEAPAAGQTWNDDIVWAFLALGIVVGATMWAVLVSRGVVQAKGRKQVATTAAHVEAAANDSLPVLEGRKRALLAALKEIEVAKMNNEMPNEVYDVVKADLKKQAVTVMRALETATAAGESGKSA
ncbi:MAG: hypothetical protein WC876_09575 [Candidatus Thermoplasmatota archaeon]|jgi:hypothetical protein